MDVQSGKARVIVVLVIGNNVIAGHQFAEPPSAGDCRVVLAATVGQIGNKIGEKL
jgi:hypothetical protein